MATKPVVGASAGTWGTELNAYLNVSLDTNGKIKNEALQTASTAPVADAALVNKKYVDDQITASGQSIKAWVQFAGSDGTIQGTGFNVSGVVRNGAGDYTISWDTDFADTDYVVIGMATPYATSYNGIVNVKSGTTPLVGSVTIKTQAVLTGTIYDPSLVFIMAIGTQ